MFATDYAVRTCQNLLAKGEPSIDVKGGVAHAVFPAKLRHCYTALSLAQNRKDLGFAKSRRFHANLLVQCAEKILLINPLSFRGDYPSTIPAILF